MSEPERLPDRRVSPLGYTTHPGGFLVPRVRLPEYRKGLKVWVFHLGKYRKAEVKRRVSCACWYVTLADGRLKGRNLYICSNDYGGQWE